MNLKGYLLFFLYIKYIMVNGYRIIKICIFIYKGGGMGVIKRLLVYNNFLFNYMMLINLR